MDAIREIDALEGKRIRSYTTFVGAGGPRFWLSIEPEQRADNYAQILVHTADKHETAAIVARLKEELPAADRRGARPDARCSRPARPSASRCSCGIFGDDIQTLRELAAQVKARMRAIPGTIDVHDDWGDPVFQMTLKIDSDRAAMSGADAPGRRHHRRHRALRAVGQPAPRARQAHRHRAAAAALGAQPSWTTCSASTW